MADLSDDFPVLLGPVRIETRFTPADLLVRVFPDAWSVDAFEPKRTKHEHLLALRFWIRIWQAGGDPGMRQAAWRDLVDSVGAGRASWIIENRKPLNPAEEPHRAGPGQVILVAATEDPVLALDRGPATDYWTSIWKADGDKGLIQAANTLLESLLGILRANVIRALRPVGLDIKVTAGVQVSLAFLHISKVNDNNDTKAASWTTSAKARLLPDAFTLLGYVGDNLVVNVTGAAVPDTLAVSPDPSTPLSDQLRAENGALHVPSDLKWVTDFNAAVAAGMGFRVPLTPQIRGGLDRLVVLGLRTKSNPAKTKADLEKLITNQRQSRLGYRLVPQGTPTNNTGHAPSSYGRQDEAAESFPAALGPVAAGVAPGDWTAKTDGQWLAELLGIDPKVTAKVPEADGTDQREARAMNTALWPATWGYHLHTMLNPMFGSAAVAATRSFFLQYVSGRGPLPAVQIGRQPYGILPTTAFSRLTWPDGGPDTAHRRKLHAGLEVAAHDWTSLAAQVAHLGKGGDPHALLLDLLGLHPTSVEYHQRYAQSVADYYNRLNLGGDGPDVTAALATLGMGPRIRELLTRLGYDPNGPDPDAMGRLFVGRQHALGGPLVDDRPLSESERVRPYDEDGRNYLGWLAHYARRDFEKIRKEEGFTGGRPPTALLYLLLRHAVLLAYDEASLRLAADTHGHGEDILRAARREPPFVHVSKRTQVSESRFRRLYAPDDDVTGQLGTLLAKFIPAIIGQRPATRELGEHLDAIELLAQAPTARLERVLAEHLDCCSYRLDAWRLGLANERLFTLRYGTGAGSTAKTGLYVGSYGWLEDVRPRTTQPTPVTLTGELAQIFTPPGATPLLHDPGNGGYVHAPSLNHATTAALLRTGYLANASPDNPDTLKVNLSSERVRVALSFLDGIRAGQSLGALLGYRLERGLHDRHDLDVIDPLITALRAVFPLVTEPDPGTSIDKVEARAVIDGLALVLLVTRTGPATYPFGKNGLPQATLGQAAAINAEVQRLVEIHDAIADLAVAESMHQAVLGNTGRAAATLDAFTKSGSPPEPAIASTPRSGLNLSHRVALHLKAGLNPGISPILGMAMTPRGRAEPSLNDWLAGLLPAPADVVCRVRWTDPSTGTAGTRVVTQAELGLQPIDLLSAVRPRDEAAMTDLDDRIVARVRQAETTLRADVELKLVYAERIAGKVTFFELSPLVASLRTLLVKARSVRPGDLVRPASGEVPDGDLDDTVDLPRARPVAVRDALKTTRTAFEAYSSDLGGKLADPVANRAALVSGVDGYLTKLADLLVSAGGCGLVRSGWGELTQWRREVFGQVLAAVAETAERMAGTLATADIKIAAYDGLPGTATTEQRYVLLQAAERLLTTTPTSPRPDTPAKLRTVVGNRRTTFAGRVTALTAIHATKRTTLSGLLADVAKLLPLAALDPAGLSLTPYEDAAIDYLKGLLARANGVRTELTERLGKADDALKDYDAAAAGPDRAAAAIAAIRAMLGADAVATSEFTVPNAMANEWRLVLGASDNGRLTRHLQRDFPVDDWLHGLARVRPKLALWERITLLGGTVGRKEPALALAQFPFTSGDPWLGLEIPAEHTIDGDHLLYTAHYADTVKALGTQCAILLDEWTEVIPKAKETTGIAFHHDRPGAEPPQTMLLVAPPVKRGTWRFDDVVAALHETFALAKSRAVEPGQLDGTGYAQLLPATVMAATPKPITISTDLAANNAPPAPPASPTQG